MGSILPAVVVLFVTAQGFLLLYSAHRYATLWRSARGGGPRRHEAEPKVLDS